MNRDKDQTRETDCDAKEPAIRAALSRPDFADIVLQSLASGARATVVADAGAVTLLDPTALPEVTRVLAKLHRG